MKQKIIIDLLQQKIAAVNGMDHVDEDWGQLDEFAPHPPIQGMTCLIDVEGANFSNIGMHKTQKPVLRQEGTGIVTLTFAKMKLTNSSAKAPKRQQEQARSIHDVIDATHEVIQGFKPSEGSGVLVRLSFRRIRRDDGLQQYRVVYTFAMHNV